MNTSFGFFDSDCLTFDPEKKHKQSYMKNFSYRERISPHAKKIDKIYEYAEKNNIVVIFTQCCGANPTPTRNDNEILVVPRNSNDKDWISKVKHHRIFNIEKIYESKTPLESFNCRHFDTFQHNSNADILLRILDIDRWVVFGHGLDLCVDTSVKGIINNGYNVTLLTDILKPSATGYGPFGTEESGDIILKYLSKIGVVMNTLDNFLNVTV